MVRNAGQILTKEERAEQVKAGTRVYRGVAILPNFLSPNGTGNMLNSPKGVRFENHDNLHLLSWRSSFKEAKGDIDEMWQHYSEGVYSTDRFYARKFAELNRIVAKNGGTIPAK